MATVDDKKIIFSMVGLNKTIQQNNKQVLKNIYLSFFYGAKIGIIGLNGSGKSTLLKIIAGLDKSYQGEVVFSPGYSVGYLAQEPYLDPTKTVKEIVMEGVQPIVDALAEYEEINQKFGLPEYYEDQDKMDKLYSRLAELQDIIDATDAWNLDSKLERAMDALRCPPEDQSVEHLSGGERRRVALCRLLLTKPDVLLLDEPSLGLAPIFVQHIFEIIQKINRERKTTVFLVEQNAHMALKIAHKGYVLQNGAIKLADSSERLLANEATKSYLPIDGLPEFDAATQELLFGAGNALAAAGRTDADEEPATGEESGRWELDYRLRILGSG